MDRLIGRWIRLTNVAMTPMEKTLRLQAAEIERLKATVMRLQKQGEKP
jgi:hypothetical protein